MKNNNKDKFYKFIKERRLGIPFEEELGEKLKDKKFKKAWDASSGDIYLDIATEVIMARRNADLSQKELAKKIGTSQQAVSRLEDPKYKGYTVRTLDKLATALGRNLEIKFPETMAEVGGVILYDNFSVQSGFGGAIDSGNAISYRPSNTLSLNDATLSLDDIGGLSAYMTTTFINDGIFFMR